jgi:HlyD family secretion protein
MKRALSLLVVALAIGTAGYAVLRAPGSPPAAAVEERPASPLAPHPVVALGRLEPVGQVARIGAPTNAGQGPRVARLLAEEGATVQAGAILAELDSLPRADADIATAAADVALRRTALARAREAAEADRSARRMAVARAEADLGLKEIEVNRLTPLVRLGAVTGQSYDRARVDRELAVSTLAEARAQLARAEVLVDGQPLDVAVAERELASSQATLTRARTLHEDALVRAPMTGRILLVHVRPGERIGSDGLLEMGATDRMIAIVEVYESDVGRVLVGTRAEVRARSLGEPPLTGAVSRVGLAVRRQSVVNADPSANTDARVVEVHIALDPPSSARAADRTRLQVRASLLPGEPGVAVSRLEGRP